jgi:hypothetical protein
MLQEFMFHQILPLMARPAPMWEYIRVGDPSRVAEGNLPEESVARVAWMVLGSASREPAVGEGLAPFLMYELRPDDLPYLGEVYIPLASRGKELRTPSKVLLRHREACPLCYP